MDNTERDDIILNRNTAQSRIIYLLKYLPKGLEKFDFNELELKNETLYGDIDFSVFEKYNFKEIKQIIFGKSKITQIINLPKTLEIFNCTDNLLISLENFPSSLIEINVSGNFLSYIDLRQTPNLKKLNVSHNEFKEIDYLPPFIEDINIADNAISQLELLDLNKLQRLNCSNNYGIVLNNVPQQLKNIVMNDDNITDANVSNVEINHIARTKKHANKEIIETDKNYVESLNDYFQLKAQYEKKSKELKKKAYQRAGANRRQGIMNASRVIPPCVNCKRNVGSVFSKGKKDNKYTVVCGDAKQPCNLNIQIYSAVFFNFNDMLYNFKEHIEELKQDIIEQKLRTLFNFYSDAVSADIFKRKLEEFNNDNELYKELYEQYNNLHNNAHKKELIEIKNGQINEMMDAIKKILEDIKDADKDKRELLKTAMDIQVNNLIPEIINLRRLKYEIMEVNNLDKGVSVLFQNEHSLSKIVYSSDEPSKVVKYVT
jgi:hypothetical protein